MLVVVISACDVDGGCYFHAVFFHPAQDGFLEVADRAGLELLLVFSEELALLAVVNHPSEKLGRSISSESQEITWQLSIHLVEFAEPFLSLDGCVHAAFSHIEIPLVEFIILEKEVVGATSPPFTRVHLIRVLAQADLDRLGRVSYIKSSPSII